MPCTISGKVVTYTATGSFSGQDQKLVYLIPSRTGFEFTNDAGATWALWEGDPNLDETYPGAISVSTNNNGDWSIDVPYTDTEVQLPGGAPLPELYWNIVDPNSPTTRVYTGQTASAVVGASKTTQELIALPAPDTWSLGPDTYYAVPAGVRRQATVSWTSSDTQRRRSPSSPWARPPGAARWGLRATTATRISTTP